MGSIPTRPTLKMELEEFCEKNRIEYIPIVSNVFRTKIYENFVYGWECELAASYLDIKIIVYDGMVLGKNKIKRSGATTSINLRNWEPVI